jgi:hypothetical protein
VAPSRCLREFSEVQRLPADVGGNISTWENAAAQAGKADGFAQSTLKEQYLRDNARGTFPFQLHLSPSATSGRFNSDEVTLRCMNTAL